MTLPAIRDAVVSTLSGAGLGEFVTGHPGRLTTGDLKRVVDRGKSTVLVGLIGIPAIDLATTGTDFTTQWAAFVITRDSKGLGRDDAAMLLVASIGQIVAGNVWGLEDIDQPRRIRADNLHCRATDEKGVALWAVTWRQVWTPAEVSLADLDDFLIAHVDYDINADGGADATDIIDLPQ